MAGNINSDYKLGKDKPKRQSPAALRREIREKAINEGITPLEAMLGIMREWYIAAYKETNAARRRILQREVIFVAEKAAPYMHNRLSAIQMPARENSAVETSIQISFISSSTALEEEPAPEFLDSPYGAH